MGLSFEQICRRAGGRRRYNARRKDAARARQKEIGRLLDLYGVNRRGTRARIARELGVSRATVTRDVQKLLSFEELYALFRTGRLSL